MILQSYSVQRKWFLTWIWSENLRELVTNFFPTEMLKYRRAPDTESERMHDDLMTSTISTSCHQWHDELIVAVWERERALPLLERWAELSSLIGLLWPPELFSFLSHSAFLSLESPFLLKQKAKLYRSIKTEANMFKKGKPNKKRRFSMG